jgi:dedicated sortase system histidine kinase
MKAMRFSLRSKLALVSILLLALPWVGYRYVQEMERFLRDGQRAALVATARAVATALHERPQLFSPATGGRSRVSIEHSILPNEEVVDLSISSMPELPATPDTPAPGPPPRVDGAREVAAILRGLERNTARIWVVDRGLEVVAMSGALVAPEAATEPGPVIGAWRRLTGADRRERQEVSALLADTTPPSGQAVSSALFGATASWVRPVGSGDVVVVAAAHPVWVADRVQGAVVVEESTHAILSVRDRAIERLTLLSLTGIAIAAVVLLGFASRLSWRIRRLRDEAESAVDAQGRITRLTAASRAGDEVGDLSRSFSRLLGRLAQHHGYLETMASRLSHELRTPIAVVRSSLENLQLDPLPAASQAYIDRAHAGLARLTRILSRMSEATRMEQALASTETEAFDLAAVVRECVQGYRLAHGEARIAARLPAAPLLVRGAPDLAAQMLDKLVDNAVDFATAGTPVRIGLEADEQQLRLCVSNDGPPLPEALEGKLFDSMVSGRQGDGGEDPHLGLGLYVARLIADFHGGRLGAENLPGGGVRFCATLPRAWERISA